VYFIMSGSYYTLNNKYNQLLALLNSITGGGGGGVPTSSNLAVVLDNGNSAGTFDIDMNNNDILNCNNLQAVTINGNPIAGAQNLNQVLTTGNTTSLTALFQDTLIAPTVINTVSSAGMSSNDVMTLTATNGVTIPSEVAFTNAIAPTCLANPQGPTDLCNKQYVDSQSALTAYQLYFNYSIPYTVPSGATYQTLSSSQVNTPTTVAWTTSSTAPVFLGGFFNLLSTLNITSISAGVWTLLLFANLTSITGQGREAFFYTIIGTASSGAETILYTSPASLLLNTVTPLIGSVSIQGTIPLISLTGYTGLGIKLYIQANSATLTTGSVIYQTPSAYSSILTSVLPISAISTLSQVLVAGNSAGLTSINMNNNNISSVASLFGQAVQLTNTTATTTLNVASGSATTTTLLTKFNNQRTAQTGEAIRLDFNAKNSAGTEFNYGKIHMNTPAVTAGSERGRMDLDVNDSVGLSTYLSANGNTNHVDIFRELDMNTNNIINIAYASTANISQLAPQKVDFLTTNGVVPSTGLDTNQRYVCANAGAVSTWINSGVNGFPGVDNVTASCVFYFTWWVGTSSGNLYWSNDNGVNWTFKYAFGGQINCLTVYNSGNNMAVGGNFSSGGFVNLAGVDTGFTVIDITGGSNGLNAEVKCFCVNSTYNCLYIGGSFTNFNGGGGSQTNAFFTYDYNTNTWYNFDNTLNGGFTDNLGNVGTVNAISRDNSGLIVVGGSWDIVVLSSGTQSIPYLFTYTTSNGYQVASYFSIGSTLNAKVNTLLDYNSGGILVGGDFTGLFPSFDNYGILIIWTGAFWTINSYPTGGGGSAPISSIVQPAGSGTNIYTLYNNGSILYLNATVLPPLPIGTAWGCIAFSYPSSNIFYATNAQTSAGFLFYSLNTAPNVTLTSVYPIKQYSTLSHTNIDLLGTGSIAELIWNAGLSEWYIISSYGATFT
jgi:hypothetical protein